MLKVTHDTIEYDGKIIADMRPVSSPVFKNLIEEIEETNEFAGGLQNGDYTPIQEFKDLEKQFEKAIDNLGGTKRALESLQRELENILDTCDPETNKAFEDFYSNLITVTEGIET